MATGLGGGLLFTGFGSVDLGSFFFGVEGLLATFGEGFMVTGLGGGLLFIGFGFAGGFRGAEKTMGFLFMPCIPSGSSLIFTGFTGAGFFFAGFTVFFGGVLVGVLVFLIGFGAGLIVTGLVRVLGGVGGFFFCLLQAFHPGRSISVGFGWGFSFPHFYRSLGL